MMYKKQKALRNKYGAQIKKILNSD